VTDARRPRRIPLLVWIVTPIALAALLAWPLGGWDTVTLVSRTLPEYESNQVLHAHRFDIRVDDAWLTTDHPAGYGAPQPGEIYLVVRADFTNVTDDTATASELGDYLIPIVEGVEPHEYNQMDYVLALDHTALPELNPGLPRELELVWTVPSDAISAGDDLRIDLYDGVPAKSILFYGLRWDFVPAGYAIRNVDAR
jgi:hypothetical protein